MQADSPDTVHVVYDGECPFCSNYVKFLKLRKALGTVRLVDARSDDPIALRLRAEGYDLDEGMALVEGGRVWHGEECINRLALMSTSSDLFNKLNAAVFRSRTASRVLYPILRPGRNLTLRMMGRKRIADTVRAGSA